MEDVADISIFDASVTHIISEAILDFDFYIRFLYLQVNLVVNRLLVMQKTPVLLNAAGILQRLWRRVVGWVVAIGSLTTFSFWDFGPALR